SARASWKHVAERFYLGKVWYYAGLLALVIALLPVAMDARVEQEGLLAGLRQRALFGGMRNQNTPAAAGQQKPNGVDVATLLAAILLSFPYVAVKSWEGWRIGRFRIIRDRLLAIQGQERRALEEAWRNRPDVQTAFHALADVAVAKTKQER